MHAIVLAAGEGTRMRPLTYTRPKVMLPVLNKPILEHLLIELKKAEIDEIVCVVGYRDETIRSYFGNGKKWGLKVKYITQRRQLGTADALKSSSHLIDDDFLMLNGDAIVESRDIKKIMKTKDMAMGVVRVNNPEDFGVVDIKKGKVVEIVEKPEKPPSDLINAGIYYFHNEVVSYLEKTPQSVRGEYEITDTVQMMIKDGFIVRAKELSTWIDVGYPWDMLNANEKLLARFNNKKPVIKGELEGGVVIKGYVEIGEDTIVRSGAYIIGPTIIGRNCDIGPSCFIRPSTVIGNKVRIGNGVEVKNSIIMSNSKIPHLSYVGDSVIGENCNLGAGTVIANLRLDKKEISVSVKEKSISTKRRKFGAVLGDGVMTGINVTINIGAMVGNNVFIAPAAKVEGCIEPNSVVF